MARAPVLLAAAVAALGAALFASILRHDWLSDIQGHNELVAIAAETGHFPPNGLYYRCVAALAGFSTDRADLAPAAAILLTLAVVAKFLAACRVGGREVHKGGGAVTPLFLAGVFGVTLAMNLPLTPLGGGSPGWSWDRIAGRMYLGFIPPNVWHNSTTIFLMPFALALFGVSLRYLDRPNPASAAAIAALCLLNVAIKPSYFFVFAVVFPAFALVRFRLRRDFWLAVLPVLAAGLFLLDQYRAIFAAGSVYDEFYRRLGLPTEGGVRVAFLHVWRLLTPDIGLAVLGSFAYPLCFLAVRGREVLRDRGYLYTLAHVVVAVGIFALLAEKGVREGHANFLWQAVVCTHLWFLMTWAAHWRQLRRGGGPGAGDALVIGVFVLHVAAGVAYYVKYFATGHFL
ncbi:MAG TPA: hypothetical protein VIL46_09205 [Gemmataceae bacterium]